MDGALPSTALAHEEHREAGGSVGIYAQLSGDAGHEGLQRVGEALAARHSKGREVWVWVWAWDMDRDGPAACLSYARPDVTPVTEWTDPKALTAYYLHKHRLAAQQRAGFTSGMTN